MQINLTQKAVRYFGEVFFVPVWAKYLAVDEDGTLTAFENEPQWCECIDGDGFWVLTEPGIEIDICYNVDLEGMDFKETCVNIDYKVSDNPHDHTELFERMRKDDLKRTLNGQWTPACGQLNKEGDKDE